MNTFQPTTNFQQPTDDMNNPISPDARQNLKDMAKKINDQIEYLNAINFSSARKVDLERKKDLKEVFDKMAVAGVDLTNRQSVANFLNKLKQQAPESAALFEANINSLMQPEDGTRPSKNNMNNKKTNEILSETL